MNKDDLILRFLINNLTLQESEDFNQWIMSNPANIKKVEDYKTIWESTEHYPKEFKLDITKALTKVHDATGMYKNLHPVFSINLVIKVAASFLILLCLTGLLRYFYLNTNGSEVIVVADNTEVKEVVLPDSTHVWLNKNSILRYPSRFAQNRRKIRFSGEGYFEVKKNKLSPFSVELANSSVKVLGTHFTIKENMNHLTTVVTVSEGRVNFLSSKNSVVLNSNERAVLDNVAFSLVKEKNSDINFLSWKTHVLEFHDTPLGEVMQTLAIQYHVNIKVTNANINTILINGLFNNKKLREILYSLSSVSGAKIVLHNDTIIIK